MAAFLQPAWPAPGCGLVFAAVSAKVRTGQDAELSAPLLASCRHAPLVLLLGVPGRALRQPSKAEALCTPQGFLRFGSWVPPKAWLLLALLGPCRGGPLEGGTLRVCS